MTCKFNLKPQIGDRTSLAEAEVFWAKHTPSWKVYDHGTAYMNLRVHREAGWLSIDATETPENGRGGKRVMLTLDKVAALALRDFLNDSLKEVP